MRHLFDAIADLEPAPGEGSRHVVVLAGVEGPWTRTRRGPRRAPAFCRVGAGPTPVDAAVAAALGFAGSAERVTVTTSRPHRAEANECLAAWPGLRRVEQPADLGTLPEVLLGILSVATRAPRATVLVLPAATEPCAGLAAHAALAAPQGIAWLRPAAATGSDAALHGRASVIAALARDFAPEWWAGLTDAFFDPLCLEQLYRTLPRSSFAREVLAPAADRRRVLPLPVSPSSAPPVPAEAR